MSDTNRAKADFKDLRVHGMHLEHRKIDALPGVIMKAEAEDGQSIADRELKRMVHGDVFRSNAKTVKEMNDQHRERTDWGPSKSGRKYDSK